jgi:hypothetical protein
MLEIDSIAPLVLEDSEVREIRRNIKAYMQEYDESQSDMMMMYKVMMSNGIKDKYLLRQKVKELMKSKQPDNVYIQYIKFREKFDAFKRKWTDRKGDDSIPFSIVHVLAPCIYLLEILIYMNIAFGIDRNGKNFLEDDEDTYKKLRTDFIIKAYETNVDIQDAVDVPICDLGAEYITNTNQENVFLFLCEYELRKI